MKISLITIHDIGNNYGSTLQSSALYRYLTNLGYRVELVDYRPQYQGRLRNFVVNLLFYVNYLKRKNRFFEYYRSYMDLTRKYSDFRALSKNPPEADVYMVGSDQVWNLSFPCGQDGAYYLDYIDSSNKISYASSLGRVFSSTELDLLKKKIGHFAHVSVREKYSREQLLSVGVNAKYVLDPVFLLNRAEYAGDMTLPPCTNYLLVYAVNKDRLIDSVSSKIASELNLKVVLIGGFAKKIKCDYFYRSAGPREFLGLVANADYVLTSSFHGAAFSLIFEKQFSVILPKINSLRIVDLLNSLSMEERVMGSFDDYETYKNVIDYNAVKQKLDPLIAQSKSYLVDTLGRIRTELHSVMPPAE